MKKECIKFGPSNYGSHTPIIIRKWGNSISAFLTTVSLSTFFTDHPTVAFVIMITNSFIQTILIPLFGVEDECLVEEAQQNIADKSVDKEI